MNISSPLKKWIEIIFFFSTIIIALLNYTIPENASEEYRYTIKVLFKYFAVPCFFIIAGIFLFKKLKLILHDKISISLGITGLVCVLIPYLSPDVYQVHWGFGILYSLLWAIGTLSLGVLLFIITGRLNGSVSGLFSIFGTLFLIWGMAEIFYLVMPQGEDGKFFFTKASRYVLNNEAQPGFGPGVEKISGIFPDYPAHPSHAVAQAARRYNRVLYDVRYSLDKHGHRVVALNPEKPQADLLLFGCSYTFGHGLEDEQTWAWKLSQDLGPDWRVTNYAMSGFGSQQMLGMLEEHELDPVPNAGTREALFLSIRHHIHRYTGIYYKNKSIKYKLVQGRLERDGYNTESSLQIIPALPFILNGSQAFRALSDYLTASYISKYQEELLKTYAAIIIRSSQLLKDEYGTHLTVLLWPDIEDLAPYLEKEAIPVLFARTFFKDWNSPEDDKNYQIAPAYEFHPNEKAADELAAGLADYYRNIFKAPHS